MHRPSTIAITMGLGLAAAGCGDNGDDAPPTEHVAYVVAGDFADTGVFSTVDIGAKTAHANAVAGVAGGDPLMRKLGDELLIVNRAGGENVTVLGGTPLARVDQFPTGAASNPQDMALAGGKLYVPAMGTAGVVVINRATRATSTITIAGDPDGKPDCVSAYAVGNQVFVACGLLDENFAPRGDGLVAVIDAATDTVTTTVRLPAPNPIGLFTRMPGDGDLLIGTAPSFNDFSTGCLARVEVGGAHTTRCLVSNADLGGLANHIEAPADGSALWVAVTGFSADFSTQFGRARGLDPVTGVPWPAFSAEGQRIDDIADCGDGLVVGTDGTMGASGVRIWQDSVELTTAPLDIGRATGPGNGLICR